MQIRSSYVVLHILSKWYGIQVILRIFLNVLVSKEKNSPWDNIEDIYYGNWNSWATIVRLTYLTTKKWLWIAVHFFPAIYTGFQGKEECSM